MREAYFYQRLNGGKVKCSLCPRECLISEGKRGYCETRENRNGKLYSLIYGQVASLSVNPIEKKPVFHFYPGSLWLSLGSLGCNFRCSGCQNWQISHARPGDREGQTSYLHPVDLVHLAKERGCLGISWTFNEPAIWLEYTLEGAKHSKKAGLYTNYVTNGYMNVAVLDTIGPYLDVFRVDIKAFSKSSYEKIGHINNFIPILEVTKRAKEKWGMHVEVVTNIIPGLNDNEVELKGIATWIYRELGPFIPWHVTRFHPHLELSHLRPTPIATLEKAQQIGFEAGLSYVYLGNVPEHPGENTYCHQCHKLLIKRYIFDILEYKLNGCYCGYCSALIPGRFS